MTAASVSGGALTYTVAANTGAARDGSVTIAVEGGNSITVTISQLAGSTDWSTVYTSNVTMAGGTNGSACKVSIASTQYNGIKVGTGSLGGDMTITVPAHKTKLYVHAAAWKGVTGLSLNITGATTAPTSISLTADDGISSNSPFTFSGDPSTSSYFFEISVPDSATATTLKFTTSTKKRFVIWGANAE